ncbi:MAG: glutaminase [Rhodocyclaceae bacterium]|nr:glutaminase [Rhodocyclaceae bacterium]
MPDTAIDLQAVLDDIVTELRPRFGEGQVATYIPALARVDAGHFGIALRTRAGAEYRAGEADRAFSIQSISKVFSLALALRLHGSDLWAGIGREPSGNPFNSLVQLETEQGVPRNPFINAGAILVADRLVSGCDDPRETLRAFVSSLCGETIAFDEEVAASEAATGFRNVALANFMKSFGRLENPVDTVLDLYFHQCALAMSCTQLARAMACLCADGRNPLDGSQVLTDRQARRINALMLTCGTYDAAGEFAFRIGLPCKSGVGGGIVATVPDELSLCVWSPGLDETGNSALGMAALEAFVSRTGLSVF